MIYPLVCGAPGRYDRAWCVASPLGWGGGRTVSYGYVYGRQYCALSQTRPVISAGERTLSVCRHIYRGRTWSQPRRGV